MTEDRFERLARGWIRQGPETAPAWPIEAALVEIDSTPQEGSRAITRRIATMSTPARIAAVLVVAAAAVLVAVNLPGGLVGGPGPSASPGTTSSASAAPTSSPADTPPPTPPTVEVPLKLDGRFTSAVHGFSLRYPREWDVRRAAREWGPNDTLLNPGSQTFDVLGNGTVRFSGASQPLAEGQTPGEWLDWYWNAYDPFRGACIPFELPEETVFVGEHEARVNFDGCPLQGAVYDGAPIFDIFLVVDGRGYNFALEGAVNRAYLERILSTVVIRPVIGMLPVTIPAFDTTFTSSRYGFSVRYPAGWAVRPATETWESSTSPLSLGSPKLDELSGSSARFSAASQALPAGWGDQQWYDWYFQFPPECVGYEGEPWTEVVVNERTWRVFYDGCPLDVALVPGGVVFGAITVVDGRGYDVAVDGAVNREFFKAILTTVAFEPVP